MKTSELKTHIIAIIAAIMLCAVPTSAQSVKKHIVERGETLASIAGKYGVSQEEITRLNPDASQFVYVGMELTIPGKTEAATVNNDENTVNQELTEKSDNTPITAYKEIYTNKTNTTAYKETYKAGDTETTGEINVKYIALSGDGAEIYKSSILGGMGFAFGARYFFNEQLFMEGLIGYQWRWINIEKKYGDGDLRTHSIYLPVRIGAKIGNFSIKAGPYLDYVVSGKQEIGTGNNKTKSKVKDDRFSVGASLGLIYKSFEISFGLGLTDFCGIKKCKETFISIGLAP